MKPAATIFVNDGRLETELSSDLMCGKYGERVNLYAIDFTKFKVVPLEPDGNQLNNGVDEGNKITPSTVTHSRYIYKGMIEAAPDIEDL